MIVVPTVAPETIRVQAQGGTIEIVIVEAANQARTRMTLDQAQQLIAALQQAIAGAT